MAKKQTPPGLLLIYHILTGTLCTIILGYLFAGHKIFVPFNPEFQFTLYGLLGSLMLGILKFRSLRDFIMLAVIIFIMELLTYRISSVGIVSGRLIYMLGLAVALYLYYTYFEQSGELRIGKFAALAGLLGLMNLLITLLALTMVAVSGAKLYILTQSTIGLLLGAGIGLGFELTTWSLKINKEEWW